MYLKESLVTQNLQFEPHWFNCKKPPGDLKPAKSILKKIGFLLTTIIEKYNHDNFVQSFPERRNIHFIYNDNSNLKSYI